MTTIAKHPEYTHALPYWEQLRDTIEGERAVKEAGVKYLPATEGMLQVQSVKDRDKIYDAYKGRAVFPNIVEETIEGILGLMADKKAKIELPEKLLPYEDQITPDGLDLQALLRFVNRQQVEYGRVGILIDVKDGGTSQDLPYMSTYAATAIVNWDSEFVGGEEVLKFVVLDESSFVFNEGSADWELKALYRVLVLVNGVYGQYTTSEESQVTATPDEELLTFPSVAGRTLNAIPFVFANSRDTTTTVPKPPLLSISNLSLSAYRQDADYRAALYFAGQPTLTATGVEKSDVQGAVIGSHAMLYSSNPQAKFAYCETAGNAIDASKTAVDDLKSDAIRRGVSFVEQGVESGKALENRMASKTASVRTIVETGRDALMTALWFVCEWVVAPYDDIVIEPNTDFINDNLTAQDLQSLMNSKNLGAPISFESIHGWMKDRGYTGLDWEDEQERILEELTGLVPQESAITPTLDEPEEDGEVL
jgi:hypothetical protein